jgi:hypothetical protein
MTSIPPRAKTFSVADKLGPSIAIHAHTHSNPDRAGEYTPLFAVGLSPETDDDKIREAFEAGVTAGLTALHLAHSGI